MAQLIPSGELKKIMLPSSADETVEDERGWCVIEVGELTAGDMLRLQKMDETITPLQIQFFVLLNRLKEWNLKDTSGNIAPINFNTVSRMHPDDLTCLFEELNKQGEASATIPLVPTTSAA